MITGVRDPVSVKFTQSGQIAIPIDSLGCQFTGVVGTFFDNFVFAFQGDFILEQQ